MGAALAAGLAVLAVRAFRVDALEPVVRTPPRDRITIALDYWERGCVESRPFHENSKLRGLRDRLQMSIEMEMREKPPVSAGLPVDVRLCLDGAGQVSEVNVVPSRAGVKWKDDIGRLVSSWRYTPGDSVCSFERLWVRDAPTTGASNPVLGSRHVSAETSAGVPET